MTMAYAFLMILIQQIESIQLLDRCKQYNIDPINCQNSVYMPNSSYDNYLKSFNLPIQKDPECANKKCLIIIYKDPARIAVNSTGSNSLNCDQGFNMQNYAACMQQNKEQPKMEIMKDQTQNIKPSIPPIVITKSVYVTKNDTPDNNVLTEDSNSDEEKVTRKPKRRKIKTQTKTITKTINDSNENEDQKQEPDHQTVTLTKTVTTEKLKTEEKTSTSSTDQIKTVTIKEDNNTTECKDCSSKTSNQIQTVTVSANPTPQPFQTSQTISPTVQPPVIQTTKDNPIQTVKPNEQNSTIDRFEIEKIRSIIQEECTDEEKCKPFDRKHKKHKHHKKMEESDSCGEKSENDCGGSKKKKKHKPKEQKEEKDDGSEEEEHKPKEETHNNKKPKKNKKDPNVTLTRYQTVTVTDEVPITLYREIIQTITKEKPITQFKVITDTKTVSQTITPEPVKTTSSEPTQESEKTTTTKPQSMIETVSESSKLKNEKSSSKPAETTVTKYLEAPQPKEQSYTQKISPTIDISKMNEMPENPKESLQSNQQEKCQENQISKNLLPLFGKLLQKFNTDTFISPNEKPKEIKKPEQKTVYITTTQLLTETLTKCASQGAEGNINTVVKTVYAKAPMKMKCAPMMLNKVNCLMKQEGTVYKTVYDRKDNNA